MATATEKAAVLALVQASPGPWYRTADVIAQNGSALRVLEGDLAPVTYEQRDYVEQLRAGVGDDDIARARRLIERATARGARLITVLDEDYPLSLQLIYNRPPFIWVRGDLAAANLRAVAVVGTRQPSDEGRAMARDLAAGLSEAGVTVVSGLARGIDTAALAGTVDAGGRAVAVVGTGILAGTYPAENAGLAERIVDSGAIVSQFWPDAPPRRSNFPLRNVVTSGLAAGTVVVEASSTSGAKMQARLALEHGKMLFLPERLLAQQEWAQRYAGRADITRVRTLDDILDAVVRSVETPHQLPLTL